MRARILLPVLVEVGQGNSPFMQRKGNCPLCRANFRKIHYKKKIIEPEYLKIFDDESSIQQAP
jgi:hypothetical protein